ncbi:lytic murein transglycosylase [Litorimonas sp. RW-G-Af-16]|uniref:lytic murein transglycosylase n=1 Tax=Litorimonas sp. RW-G-Af-16 TaxID=3241168 RepID=UPI00390C785D
MHRFLISFALFSFALLSTSCASAGDSDADIPAANEAQTETPPIRNAEATNTEATNTDVTHNSVMTEAEKFNVWKADFMQRAVAQGYSQDLVARLIAPATINPKAIERDKTQPEFTKPVWSYVDGAASASRVNSGETKLANFRTTFDAIEARYQVPRHILTAIWGLETAYGKIMGSDDMVSSLATLAYQGRRRTFAEREMLALLEMVQDGYVRQDQLVGSWTGAMGMTQFIPTTFRDYAVDFDGDGNKDLWESEADALGSAAHYLSRHGWRASEPVMEEVRVVDGFDYGLTETTKRTVNQWTTAGVMTMNGQPWTADAGFLEAKLIAPGGHRGPKFLIFKNFDVIKKYNNSTSYAMGINVLGEALRGNTVISTPWPRENEALSFEDKKTMQRKLTALGYSTGGVDGQVGPNTRKAIRAWQNSLGLPADGYMEQDLLARLLAQ